MKRPRAAPFPEARVYVRSCEICVKLIAHSQPGHGCQACFLEGKLTLFCSQACEAQHQQRHHQPAPACG